MGTKKNDHDGSRGVRAEEPESERAAERVSDALERGVPEEELDPADAERTAHATVSPQPEPDERPDRP